MSVAAKLLGTLRPVSQGRITSSWRYVLVSVRVRVRSQGKRSFPTETFRRSYLFVYMAVASDSNLRHCDHILVLMS